MSSPPKLLIPRARVLHAAGVLFIGWGLLAIVSSFGCAGTISTTGSPLDGSVLGGRHGSTPGPDRSHLPTGGRPWHPPLLAELDSWMPARPGQHPASPVFPDVFPSPGSPGGSPIAAGSTPANDPSQGGVVPAAFELDRLTPSNHRDWIPEHQLLAWAELKGDELIVHNVRNCDFYSDRDCLVDHEDRTYRLSDLKTIDFLMVPFNEAPALAHTMLSFGFGNVDYLGISVEVRLEKGESYHPVAGLLRQFEIIYVVADERDLIRVRTEHRKCDVYAYRSVAGPQQARTLLLDILDRVNQLHDRPEFYDTLSNNCTTNIVRHVNRLAPERVPYDYRVLMPGFADNLAYELGLIDNRGSFAQVKERARITEMALRYKDSPRFSLDIRGETVQR